MQKFSMDYHRYNANPKSKFKKLVSIIGDNVLRGILYGRIAESKAEGGGIISKYFGYRSKKLFSKNGIEIGKLNNINGGLCLIHPHNITINSRARIGQDFTIFKGATVGSIRSGNKMGTPRIGDRVTICANAFVCGNVIIGDDILIAANAFVNFDVPSNSVVVGNPGIIHHKEFPSRDYLPK